MSNGVHRRGNSPGVTWRNVLRVAKREYIEHVRTKSFVVGIVMTPLLIFVWIQFSEFMDKVNRGGKPFVIVDASTPPVPGPERAFLGESPGTNLGERLAAKWSDDTAWKLEQVVRVTDSGKLAAWVDTLSARALEGELEGFAVLQGDLIAGDGRMQWYTRNVANERLKRRLAELLTTEVQADRYAWYEVPPEKVEAIRATVMSPEDIDVSGRSGAADRGRRRARVFIPMIFVYAMMIGISMQAQTLLSSTIEEKSNRLVEVLLSSISSFEMMTGKIVGLIGVTFTLMATWSAAGAYLVIHNQWQSVVPGDIFVWFLVYLVLAIVFYSTFIIAIGSAVTELKEAQNLMTPVWIVLMVPFFLMFFVGEHPDATWARVLSFVPFFTPFLMVNRVASAVPPGPIELGLSIVMMTIASVFAIWFAARVFRTAILLYGKAATPRELLRWMRAG